MVAVGVVLNVGVLPTTSTSEESDPVQPALSVTTAKYWNLELPTVAPDMVAVVTPVVVEEVGLTVVVPGDTLTLVVHA